MSVSSAPSQGRFLGIDLQPVERELRAVWLRMQRWPIVQWLSPVAPVRLTRVDGRSSVWLVDGGGRVVPAAGRSSAKLDAVELSDERYLLRALTLPALSHEEAEAAVALDVHSASPFSPDDLVWGCGMRSRKDGGFDVRAVLASRRQVEEQLPAAASSPNDSKRPEVWACPPDFPPVVFRGFGESRRMSRTTVRKWVVLALLLAALGLAVSIAATPVAQLRMRALEAVDSAERLTRQAEPTVRQRAVLLRASESGAALQALLAQRSDPLKVMELLTQVLPDDTYLFSLQIQGSKISISGLTPNAAALMQQLSARAELRDVKAPTPATRPLGSVKDSFNIEFTLVPLQPPAAAASAAVPAQGGASAPATAASATGAAAASPPASSAASAAPAAVSGGPSFGGGVVSGPRSGGAARGTP